MPIDSEHALAVLVDIENMARPGARNRGEFDIHLVLGRLAEKGRVVVKRAYADWSRYRDARRELMNAGLELIEMPSAREGAKNRADIKMAVDAMEIAYSRAHVSTFVIVSGDSDFTPLIGKLRELDKRVIGIGRDESSASSLLIANCDEFYFYDSMASKAPTRHVDGVRPDALSLLRETLVARQHEGDEHPQASAVKDSMRRRDPAFSETDIGFSTFSKFLEDAQTKGVVRLVTDPRSGTYLVELADAGGVEAPSTGDDVARAEPATGESRRRRRRRRGSDNGETASDTSTAESIDGDDEADGEVAEVFEFKVPDRERVTEMPPLDQPISYEDMLGDVEPAAPTESEEPPTRGSRRRRKALATTPEPDTADLEAATDDSPAAAAETEGTDEEAAAPKRTRRRRASTSDTPSEDSAVEAPVAEAATAEPADTPAPTSRRRVRRGSVLASLSADGETPAAESTPTAEEEAPKPKRARTTRKKADADTDAAADSDEKPKRTRTTRKKADADTDAAADGDEKPKRTRTTRKKADTDAAGDGIKATESPY